VNAWESYLENKEQSLFTGLSWNTLGPVINSGRVEALDVVPGHPEIIYAGFGSGNLWKTVNHGLSWAPIFDDHAGYTIGDIKIAPSNPSIIYVATGESLRAKRGHTIPGAGIYRSDDAGESWKALGLENTHHIGRISVHPENPEIVFVAALGSFYSPGQNRGIYKSNDGGANWKQVLYYDDRTGGNDVVISKTNPQIMYASTWHCSEDKAGPGGTLYKSVDGGDNWVKMNKGFPQGALNGRTGLAISYQSSEVVYAFTDNVNAGYKDGTGELYKTEDGGINWFKTHDRNLKVLSSYGEVFTDCYVNPLNDKEVYVLGAAILRSTDGGKSFNPLRGSVTNINPSPANYFHLDHHHMWINPTNPQHLIVGNDGGVYISYDYGDSWMHYNNIPVGEFYFVRTDNDNPYRIYSGTQDDSAVRGPAKTLASRGGDGWEYVWIDPWSGGDGIVVTPDRDDSNIVYYESQNGAIRRKNMSTGETWNIKPELPGNYPTELYNEWLTPFFTSKHSSSTLYYGANYVFKTINGGEHWSVISPDLSISSDEARKGNGIVSIEESPLKQGVLYAGTSKGAMWVSKNDGANWKEISKGLPARYVKSIAPSGFKESRVYCTLSGIGEDDIHKYIYSSEDYGNSWVRIDGNLPEAPVNVILEDPFKEDVLYCGTLNGVFISMDRGRKWHALGNSMPHSFVADMTIQERENDLIAVTHGRGIYKLDLEPLYNYMNTKNNDSKWLHVTKATLPAWDASGEKRDMDNYENVYFSYYSEHSDSVKMKIFSDEGELIFSKKVLAKKGLNTCSWNMIIGPNKSENPFLFNFWLFPEAGTYRIQIEGNQWNISKDFVISEPEK
jgi:photosystem II stability/assembly factor-like uncharacterized protein